MKNENKKKLIKLSKIYVQFSFCILEINTCSLY